MRNETLANLRLEIKVEASLESVEVEFAGGEEVCPGLLSGLVVVVLHIVVVVVVEARLLLLLLHGPGGLGGGHIAGLVAGVVGVDEGVGPGAVSAVRHSCRRVLGVGGAWV